MNAWLGIGEVASRAGVAPSALRYYESEGLLPPPARISGRRVYPGAALAVIQAIRGCREAGFSIREIRDLLGACGAAGEAGEGWRAVAEDKVSELAAAATRADEMRRWLEQGLAEGLLRIEDCPPVRAARRRTPGDTAPLGSPPGSRPRRTRILG